MPVSVTALKKMQNMSNRFKIKNKINDGNSLGTNVGWQIIALDRFYSLCFVAIKGLALLHLFVWQTGCQTAYVIDNVVDFFYKILICI